MKLAFRKPAFTREGWPHVKAGLHIMKASLHLMKASLHLPLASSITDKRKCSNRHFKISLKNLKVLFSKQSQFP